MLNRKTSGYIGFDLLFAFLAISAMLMVSVLAINQKTVYLGHYFALAASDYSLLMASDYIVKLGPSGSSPPTGQAYFSVFHHHVLQAADFTPAWGSSGAHAAGLSGYSAYLDSPPPGAMECIGRIVSVEDCGFSGCQAMPRKIFICRDVP